MRLSTWMNPLPDSDSATTANRLVALRCAMCTISDSLIADGSSHGEITTRAQKFEAWLNGTDDPLDLQIRRAVLVMICDKITAGSTPADRVRTLAKELHHHVTR